MVQGWLQIVVFVAVVVALTPLLGGYMARVYDEASRSCSSACSGRSSGSSTGSCASTRARARTGSATRAR